MKRESSSVKASIRKQTLEMLNSTPDAMVLIDKGLVIISRNNEFLDLMRRHGITRGIVRKEISSMLEIFDKYKKNISNVFFTKKEFIVEAYTKIGKEKLFFKLIARIIPIEGQIFVVLYLIDKTEQEKNKKKLVKLVEELKIANRSKDIIVGVISHDLKNKFSALLGIAGLLKENSIEDVPYVKSLIKLLVQASNIAFNTLTDLLDWYNISSKSLECKFEVFNISYIVNTIISRLEILATQKNINIYSKVDIETNVFADVNMMKSVMDNLLNNAIKFSKPQSTIKVLSNVSKNSIIISIHDEGIGMSKEIMDSLFKIPETISREGTNNEKGTGLGLAYSKRFIEAWGGKIWVKSEEGNGTTFYFTVSLPSKHE